MPYYQGRPALDCHVARLGSLLAMTGVENFMNNDDSSLLTQHAGSLEQTRQVAMTLLARLDRQIDGEGLPSEGEQAWLWGRENAVSIFAKLSGSLIKVIELERVLTELKPLGAALEEPEKVSEADRAIIARFMARRRAGEERN